MPHFQIPPLYLGISYGNKNIIPKLQRICITGGFLHTATKHHFISHTIFINHSHRYIRIRIPGVDNRTPAMLTCIGPKRIDSLYCCSTTCTKPGSLQDDTAESRQGDATATLKLEGKLHILVPESIVPCKVHFGTRNRNFRGKKIVAP